MTNHRCQLSDFKHQLNELFDAFKNLSKEDQTEAISLIRKLYIVALNCFFSEAKYRMYDSKSEICKDDYYKHLDLHAYPLENGICFSSDRSDNKSVLQLNFGLDSEVNENVVENDDVMKSTIKNEETVEDIHRKVSCSPPKDKDEMEDKKLGESKSCESDVLCDNVFESAKMSSAASETNNNISSSALIVHSLSDLENNPGDKNSVLVYKLGSKEKSSEKVFNSYENKRLIKLKKQMFLKHNILNGKNSVKNKLKEIKQDKSLLALCSLNKNVENSIADTSSVALLSCRFCQTEFFSLENFQDHKCESINYICSQTVHKCKLCSMEFTQKHHLDRHLNGHTRNNCTICNAQFTKRKALCKHLKTDHSICEPEKLYHCSFCEKHFSKRPSLNAHLKHHAEGQLLCVKCGFMCKSENVFNDHMKDHLKNSKYECMLCEKKFMRRQQYNQHMMGHERHVCSLCDMTFSTKKLLLKHQQSMHGAQVTEKKHECSVCKKLFLRPKHLQIHQRCHTGEKPVKCSHCEKSFCNDRALSKHMKTVRHLQRVNVDEGKDVEIEKPFLCAECGATFYRQQSLLRHIEIQHTTSESLKCEHCEYSTKCKANLKRHSELHTDKRRFICEICGSSFRALATLKEHHVYVHSENRSFVCSICNKAFKSKSSLQRHLRIHSEVRPYKCHCSRDYKRMSHLKRHMISAHCMTFKRNFSSKTEESSDTEINIGNQNATPNETEIAEVLQKQSSSSDDFPLFISTNHLFEHEKLSEIVMDKNINEEHISSTSVEEDNYTNVPSRNIQSFLVKPGDNITTNNSENALMTFISQSDVHSQQVSLPSPSANSKDRNSVSLDDSNLNLSPSSYCNFNLSSSSLSSFIETVPSNLQPQSTSHGILTLTPAQDNLNRPHSLPNLNFENQATNIDSFAHFSLHNRDSPSPSVSISSFLLNEMPSSPQLPDLNLEHNNPTKQLFEDSDDILTIPQYTASSHLGVTDSPTHLFSQSRNTDLWDPDTSNRLKISGSDVIASNSCTNIVSSMTNFSNMPPNTSNILSHNLIFSNDSLITCSNFTNSSDFEIV